jgi:hypothetical protein
MRRVLLFLAMIASAGSVSCTIWKNPPRGWAGATGGEQLERQLWKEISQQHWSSVQRHMATNFILAVPSGFHGSNEAVEYWKQLALKDYSLGNFQVQPNGADITVTYTITAATPGVEQDPVYVMSVWQEVGSRWLLMAQSVHPAKASR